MLKASVKNVLEFRIKIYRNLKQNKDAIINKNHVSWSTKQRVQENVDDNRKEEYPATGTCQISVRDLTLSLIHI